MENYSKLRVLGQGSFGQALLAKHHTLKEYLVIKMISIPDMSERDKQSAINEVKILSTLKHKNVILYKDAFVHQRFLCLVMEHADDGDLSDKIKNQNGRLFPEEQIIDWFVQILIAVKYIHSLNILHRDLKSQNIFLTKSGFVKIGDFGVSKYLDGGIQQAKTTIGTPFYLSPEICQRKSYDHKSDMWSLGVLIYELATLSHPFVANDFANLVVKIISGKYAPISKFYGPLLHDLILILLQVNPNDRPSASHLLKAPLLQPHIRSYLIRAKQGSPIITQNLQKRGDSKEVQNILPSNNIPKSADEKTTTEQCSSDYNDGESEHKMQTETTSHTKKIKETRNFLSDSLEDNQQHNQSTSSSSMDSGITSDGNGEHGFNNQHNLRQSERNERRKESNGCSKQNFLRRKSSDHENGSSSSNNAKCERNISEGKNTRRSSLGTFRKIIEKPKEKFLRRSSTGCMSNKPSSVKEDEPIECRDISSKGIPPQKPVSSKLIISKTKNRINFIERNKQLLGISSKPTNNSPPPVTKKIPATPSSTYRSSCQPRSNTSTPSASRKKLDASAPRPLPKENALTATFTKLPNFEPQFKEIPDNEIYTPGQSLNGKHKINQIAATKKANANNLTKKQKIENSEKNFNELKLKQRSISFDNRSYFSRLGSILKKQEKGKRDIAKELLAKPLKMERSKSDMSQRPFPPRKRYNSQALPEGFQMTDHVKRKIIGRLRATSHACDEFSEEKKQKNLIQKPMILHKKLNKEHSQTYTVLCPSVVLKRLLGEKLGEKKVEEALDCLKDTKIMKQDFERMKKAWRLLSTDNSEENKLLTLLEIKFCA